MIYRVTVVNTQRLTYRIAASSVDEAQDIAIKMSSDDNSGEWENETTAKLSSNQIKPADNC